jgi:RecA-family ATPase
MGTKKLDILEIYNKELEPLDFVFKGLKTKTIGFISSAGGTGKSMLALHLAFSLADTTRSYNFKHFVDEYTKRGKVAYLSLEDPHDVLEHRLKAISQNVVSQTNYNTLQEINKNISIYPLYGKDFTLFREKQIINQVYDTLLKLGEKNRLITIDTFRRLVSIDENDNGLMSEILKVLESIANKTGTSFLLLHHQNKSAINKKNNDQTAMRGASALVDNSRLTINLNTLSENEAKNYGIQEDRRRDYIKVSYAKVNYAKIETDFILSRGAYGTLELCNCLKENKQNKQLGKKSNNLLEGLKK